MNVQHNDNKLDGKRDQRLTAIDPGAFDSCLSASVQRFCMFVLFVCRAVSIYVPSPSQVKSLNSPRDAAAIQKQDTPARAH